MWSFDGQARAGAEEFSLLMRLAELQRTSPLAGIVGVGDRNGVFQAGAERALRVAALSGVPVLKLAASGTVTANPDALFIDVGPLSEANATRALAAALERLGAPPAAVDPLRPTLAELVAVRTHAARLRQHIATSSGLALVAR